VAEHWMLLARLDSLVHDETINSFLRDETITKSPFKPGP
jgi:hypothetical protein